MRPRLTLLSQIGSWLAVILLALAAYVTLDSQTPDVDDLDPATFDLAQAQAHVQAMSQQPHGIGSEAHDDVRDYVMGQLTAMGLTPQLQSGKRVNAYGLVSNLQNIMARIEGSAGTDDALMLLSHYDSSPHSSLGASDAASGVATVLEGLRAYMTAGNTPSNDIIVLFTDSEEIGLSGANYFVGEHPWSKDVRLVLNFEARGSGGPSFTLIETNQGNDRLMQEYARAGLDNPVANSLAYSIYKLLPNDTDLTVFRETGDIDGFNFAFIDDHYDYHTAMDRADRLDPRTLAHQGSYISALLPHFARVPLTNLKAEGDRLYFNLPYVGMVTYPDPGVLAGVLALIFVLIVAFVGLRRSRMTLGSIGVGFLAFLGVIVLACGATYLLWELILLFNPHYLEINQGFPYNGHGYVIAFIALGLALGFGLYRRFRQMRRPLGLAVGPLVLWSIIGIAASLYLPGAAYFSIPVFFSAAALLIQVLGRQPSWLLPTLLCTVAVGIVGPFVSQFPIALGMTIGWVAPLMMVLLIGYLLPVVLTLRNMRMLSILSTVAFLGFLAAAWLNGDWNEDQPKPNSLVYFQDVNKNSHHWLTYDAILDEYTQQALGEKPALYGNATEVYSKYGSTYTYEAPAPDLKLLPPTIYKVMDSVTGSRRQIVLAIEPSEHMDRFYLYEGANRNQVNFSSITVDGIEVPRRSDGRFIGQSRWNNRLLWGFTGNTDPILIELEYDRDAQPQFLLQTASNNLLTHPKFKLEARENWMIPKPEVLNDAIIHQQQFQVDNMTRITPTFMMTSEQLEIMDNEGADESETVDPADLNVQDGI